MEMGIRIIVQGEYYHVYNRGVDKKDIFEDERDWARFLFLILYFQSPVVIFNNSRYIGNYVKHRVFNIGDNILKNIVDQSFVELVAFTLMPNHFHLILKEKEEGGISKYMQRVQNAYTKYFNAKYKKSGHLFQGPYQIVHIEDNEQLLYLSAYVHLNPRSIKGWKNKEENYPWSSFGDYIHENRFLDLLKPEVILEQVDNVEEYKRLVKESGAKERL